MGMADIDPDKLLSQAKVAQILGVAHHTVGELVKPVRVSEKGRRYYTLASVREQLQPGDAA